ncbi:hypothetical protein EYF80_011193 [Liparis tanakae]|uniref:Uncharacterized protein n=1 Tax=Liparis tanakae TaxID=230148 RepID=A0A4Z2ILK0_9TELE|nr:hypothetical protein EYF80_011193 [Liparis tanakae]
MKRKSERWATSGEVTTVFWTKPSTDRLLTGSFPAARPADWPTRGRGERLKEEGRTIPLLTAFLSGVPLGEVADRRFSRYDLLLGSLRVLFSSLMLAWCFSKTSFDLSRNWGRTIWGRRQEPMAPRIGLLDQLREMDRDGGRGEPER